VGPQLQKDRQGLTAVIVIPSPVRRLPAASGRKVIAGEGSAFLPAAWGCPLVYRAVAALRLLFANSSFNFRISAFIGIFWNTIHGAPVSYPTSSRHLSFCRGCSTATSTSSGCGGLPSRFLLFAFPFSVLATRHCLFPSLTRNPSRMRSLCNAGVDGPRADLFSLGRKRPRRNSIFPAW